MVHIIGVWEKNWLEPKIERHLWMHLIGAFKIERYTMVPGLIERRNNMYLCDTMEEALKTTTYKKVFLCPPQVNDPYGEQELGKYVHPFNACYIFGATGHELWEHVTENDDVVCLTTKGRTQMFGLQVAGMVLYDRVKKEGGFG